MQGKIDRKHLTGLETSLDAEYTSLIKLIQPSSTLVMLDSSKADISILQVRAHMHMVGEKKLNNTSITPHLVWSLEQLVDGNSVNQITVDADTSEWARVALDRMLALPGVSPAAD